MSANEKTHTVKQGSSHRSTAERIYNYLHENPAEWPNDDAARAGTGHLRLIIKIDGTDSHLRVGELTGTWLDVFPNVPWSEDTLSQGVMFTKDALMSNKPYDRENTIRRLRLVLMRALRYDAKRSARLAEIAHHDATATA